MCTAIVAILVLLLVSFLSAAGGDLTPPEALEKARKAADAPDAYETGRLSEFERLRREGEFPKESSEVRGEGSARVLRYMRPIVIGSPCLACHGKPDTIDAEVAKVLSENYPGDRATGHAAGDLRGAVSVTVTLESAGAPAGVTPPPTP